MQGPQQAPSSAPHGAMRCQRLVLMLVVGAAAAAATTAAGQPAAGVPAVLAANSTRATAGAAAAAAAATTAAPAAAAGAAGLSPSGLLMHNGQRVFLTGVNLGNVHFLPLAANPYGYSPERMRAVLGAALADIAATGANCIRLWLHIDGRLSPTWGEPEASTGRSLVTGLPLGLVADLKWLLATAFDQHGLLVTVSLWSHDILAVRRGNGVGNRARAVLMMSDAAATDAYIQCALLPMLAALDAPMRPGAPSYLDSVVAWEVLNEPEGISRQLRLYKNYMYRMQYGNYSWWQPDTYRLLSRRASAARLTSAGGNYTGWHFVQDDGSFNNFMLHDVVDPYPSEWDFLKRAIVDDKVLATVEVPYRKVLRFINRVAGAIHRAAPGAKVTVGAHSIPYATMIPMPGLRYKHEGAPFNHYSDEVLVAAGGDPLGTLDLIQVHGYPVWNEPVRDANINMFLRPKAHWRNPKPILVGEHWSQVMPLPSTVTPENYVHLHDTGYAGGLGWAYFNVTETYNVTTGVATRNIGEHKCQGALRSLLARLPPRLKYPVRKLEAKAAAGAAGAAATTPGETAAATAAVVFG